MSGPIDRSQLVRPADGPTPSLTRRRLLGLWGVGALGVALASACGGQTPTSGQPAGQPAGQPTGQPAGQAANQPAEKVPPQQAAAGGFSGGGALKILLRGHFVPAYDTWIDKWAADWGTKNKVEVQIDHITSNELAAKIAAEVAATAGHDIYALTRSGEMPLYNKQMVDVGDVVKQVGDAHGGWIPLGEQVGQFQGTWKAVPEYFIDFPGMYRKDIFDENGLSPVDTWDDLLKVGTLLKGKGHPIGIAINQKSNDASNSWTSLLWTYGASTVAADGKTVTINSPQTKEALAYAVELYNKTMTNEVLSWDDTGNNLLLASGTASWIQNPISALRTIEKDNPDLAKKILLSNPPAGPKGRHTPVSTNSFGIAQWASSVPAAKAFVLDYFQVVTEGIKASEGYNQPLMKDLRKKPMPILGEDPRFGILQDFDQYAHAVGWPGPPSVAAGDVESNWIVPLTVARAVQDGDVNGAADWAQQKIEAIYARY